MFGRREDVTCPYCQHKYMEEFGCATRDYYVNESKYPYIECSCPSCETPFWYSFVEGSMEKQDSDKIVLYSVTCW